MNDDDDWDYDAPMILNLEVCDHEAVWTGLLDRHGNRIYREPEPMGFAFPKG